MIEVQNLSKTFTLHRKDPGFLGSLKSLLWREKIKKHAVCDVSFKIEPGEIVGLLGANGAGKTTLVKMLSGIIHPSSGEASVLGYTPWERNNALRRNISLIMGQKAQLWWDLPAADCFLLLKEIYYLSDQEYQESLGSLCELLDVHSELNVQIRRLSLGERMKMELIAALLHRPKVVFLDEPTIGLDFSAQKAIRKFLLEYRAVHNPIMVVTSHYMEDIKQLCKRILIIRHGDLVYDGNLHAVANQYARDKTLEIYLDTPSADDLSFLNNFKEVKILENSNNRLRIQVERNEASRVASEVLAKFPVTDLTIEEVPLESIIEKIYQNKSH